MAVLFAPQFRLQSVLLAHRAPPFDTPRGVDVPQWNHAVGLVETGSVSGVILELTPCAELSGVKPGMSTAQAMARCNALQLVSSSEPCEASLAQKLLAFAGTLSPKIETQARNRYLLDVGGLAVHDWQGWAEQSIQRLDREHGISAVLGVAPRSGLAWCAARRAFPVKVIEHPELFIESLSFAELEIPDSLQQQLADWGIRTLGELLRLPKQAALERLGPEAAPLWELARDTRECVMHLEAFPESLELEMDLESRVETLEPILFIINRMLEQLASRMRLRHRVATDMQLQLRLENAVVYERHFSLPSPSRDEAVLRRVLETHLETLNFEAAIVGVRLKLQDAPPIHQQLTLFERPLRDPNRFGETLARLHSLTGENRVGVPRRAASHRPDLFNLQDPCKVFSTKAERDLATPEDDTLKRNTLRGIPLRRFRPAMRAQVSLSGHRPAFLHAATITGPVLECAGPYRLSGNWWEVDAWRIEEWDVELGGSAPGLYRLVCEHGEAKTWTLEGCYDAEEWRGNR